MSCRRSFSSRMRSFSISSISACVFVRYAASFMWWRMSFATSTGSSPAPMPRCCESSSCVCVSSFPQSRQRRPLPYALPHALERRCSQNDDCGFARSKLAIVMDARICCRLTSCCLLISLLSSRCFFSSAAAFLRASSVASALRCSMSFLRSSPAASQRCFSAATILST